MSKIRQFFDFAEIFIKTRSINIDMQPRFPKLYNNNYIVLLTFNQLTYFHPNLLLKVNGVLFLFWGC